MTEFKQKRLYGRIFWGVIALILLSCLSIVIFIRLFYAQKELIKAHEKRYQSYLLADRLRHSSDELTRMVRTYAATGDQKFEKQFWDVLAIRDGYKNRPQYYDRIYWDFMAVNNPVPPYPDGEKASLRYLMKEAGFTEDEFKLLRKSHENSDKLVNLEKVAFNAMKGKFQDKEGNFTIIGKPDREKALQILYGKEYHDAKVSIMKPINEFFALIDLRTKQDVQSKATTVRFYLYSLLLCFISTIVVGIYTMINTRKSNLQLQEAKEAAEAVNIAKSVFISHISHEIRTPMNGILGYSAILKSRISDPESKRFLNKINENGNNLISLIDDVLDISMIDSGKVKLHIREVNLKELIQKTVSIFKGKIEEKKLELIVDIPDDISEKVMLDESRLRQVLFNLIGNAVKFTESGYIKLSVSQEISMNKVNLTFKIEDTGVGIEPELLNKIFDVFEKKEEYKMSNLAGLGLGLTIVERIVKIMGGEIYIESESGKGSIFSVILKDVGI